jgi:hypothetical protein
LATSFNDQFDQHGAWRREFALRLKLLAEWLKDHELLDSAVEERLRRLEGQMRSDKVMVAFVAEFSRGKSELINAIFFAGYKRRIMPASAGRTTMCPTELGYDAEVPPCLRLLPIETRLQPQPLMEWRAVPEKWTRLDLDVNDPGSWPRPSRRFRKSAASPRTRPRPWASGTRKRRKTTRMVGSDGLVEVPKWRHALINIAHPLLKQGLVILDTPGLNAIGAEPELTVNLIPQAHAVVFILAADTGVTKSDLAIWREHLIAEDAGRRLAPGGVEQDRHHVGLAVHARRRCRRRSIASAPPRLKSSGCARPGDPGVRPEGPGRQGQQRRRTAGRQPLAGAGTGAGEGVMGQRQKILRSAVGTNISELRTEATRVLGIRRRDLAEQMVELKGLRGKNTSVIKHMRARIEQEQADFDASGAKIHAVRSVHLKLLRDVFHLLGTQTMKSEMGELTTALRQPGIKLGVRKAYASTFDRLREGLRKAEKTSAEIQSMLTGTFRQLNAEYGFSLQAPREPDLARYERDLDLVERSHNQYLGVSNALRLAQPEFADRLVRALATRLRVIYESALGEVELWNKSAAAQLDAQLRERRRNFGRRIEAIERIQQAASGLDDRIGEIESQEHALDMLDAKLAS